MTRSVKLPAADHCPWCGYEVDAASGIKHRDPPKKDDITMCINCGEWSVFDEKLRLRKPTEAETAEIDKEPEVARGRRAWRAMQEAKLSSADKRCDTCNCPWFQEGPHGGGSMNVRCISCGSTYWAAPGNLAWGRTFNQGPELFHGKPGTLRQIFLRGAN